MKANTAIFCGSWITVFQVSSHRTSNIGQLTSDLMMTACQQFNLQQIISVRPGNQLISQD
jgi:hypothetical protein